MSKRETLLGTGFRIPRARGIDLGDVERVVVRKRVKGRTTRGGRIIVWNRENVGHRKQDHNLRNRLPVRYDEWKGE